MAQVDMWEAVVANIKEHKWTLIILLLVMLLPYLLYGGSTVISNVNFPFWKILDIFMNGLSSWVGTAAKGSVSIINTTIGTKDMPTIVSSLIKFIAYFIAITLDFVVAIKMFKLIAPTEAQMPKTD